jgi:hypothetical protein
VPTNAAKPRQPENGSNPSDENPILDTIDHLADAYTGADLSTPYAITATMDRCGLGSADQRQRRKGLGARGCPVRRRNTVR